jgi:hypothetical protein
MVPVFAIVKGIVVGVEFVCGVINTTCSIKDTFGSRSKNRIDYGSQKKSDDTHNHTGNKGGDRTPAQKAGDKKRKGPRKNKK